MLVETDRCVNLSVVERVHVKSVHVLQGAQNMTEAVWQPGRKKSYKT